MKADGVYEFVYFGSFDLGSETLRFQDFLFWTHNDNHLILFFGPAVSHTTTTVYCRIAPTHTEHVIDNLFVCLVLFTLLLQRANGSGRCTHSSSVSLVAGTSLLLMYLCVTYFLLNGAMIHNPQTRFLPSPSACR